MGATTVGESRTKIGVASTANVIGGEQTPRQPTDTSGPKDKDWKDLNSEDKYYRARDISFNWVVTPLCIASVIFSSLSWILANLFKQESKSVDKISDISNQLAYTINGFYGGVDGAWHKNITGALGCNLVALAGIFGNNENRYQLKGPGSAFDQMPDMLGKVATNPRINNPSFNSFNGMSFFGGMFESFKRTCTAIYVIVSDMVNEFKQNGFSKGFYNNFISGERTAERNLLTSSTGILAGVGMSYGLGWKKAGSTVRDVEGIHADISIIQSGLPFFKTGKKVDLYYLLSGTFYTLGSGLDLIYRWIPIPKLELVAVGMDNLGFLFMTKAMAIANEDTARNGNTVHAPEEEVVAGAQPAFVGT